MLKPLSCLLFSLLLSAAPLLARPPDESRKPEPRLTLARGICVDRQVRRNPPEAGMRVGRDDVRLIKSMGFEFVKLLLNPAVLKSGGSLDAASMVYFDKVIDMAAAEGLPVVACIHPEDDFKRRVLGSAGEFEAFAGFMTALASHLAERWSPTQVALQLMTEPYGSSPDPADWNYWDRLQQRLWTSVRARMPRHTLILSGDRIGSIEGLDDIHPVDDENVLYSFTVKLWCAEFGCYQAAASPADRLRYLRDMRSVLEERGIGWAYWSYNEPFTIMTPDSKPFWPPTSQTPDREVLKVLLPDHQVGP